MKRNVFLLSSIRQPIRTALLIILLGLISFAFVSKAVEYLIVQRETDRLGSYYRSIGSLQNTDNSQGWDVSAGAEIIQTSPYLAYADRRRVSSAVMEGIYNGDLEGNPVTSGPYADLFAGILNNDFWFYGVFESKEGITGNIGVNPDKLGYALTFLVDRVVTGYPEYLQKGQELVLFFIFEGHEDAIPAIGNFKEGQRYFVRGRFDAGFSPIQYGLSGNSRFQIRALDDDQTWYLPVGNDAEVDFNNPALIPIKQELEVAAQNQHTLSIITSADMSAMPDTQQSSRLYYLVEGRWLNHEDDLQSRNVTVVQADFAQRRGLKVGDSISMKFRALKQLSFAGYIMGEEDRQNWPTYPSYEGRFEIVGLFGATVGIDPNLAFIPNSTLPAGFEQEEDNLYFRRYSFVLNSPQDQNAFIQETKDRLAELGIELHFVDNNGNNFWASVTPLRRSASTSAAIYTVVLFTTLGLTIFLYLVQRRRDLAILRALGVPQTTARRHLLIPIALIGAAGILPGGVFSWQYALENAAASLSNVPTPAGALPSSTLNPGYLLVICAGIFFLLLALAWAGIQWFAHTPVLELLQGRSAGTVRKATTVQPLVRSLTNSPSKSSSVAAEGGQSVSTTVEGARSTWSDKASDSTPAVYLALIRYTLHQIARSRLRTLLTILVAFGFIFALGWMQRTMDKNLAEVERLYNTTVVEADIMQTNPGTASTFAYGLIAKDTVDSVMRNDFVKSAYLEAVGYRFKINKIDGEPDSVISLPVRAIDQPEMYLSTYLQGALAEYAPGWDAGLFSEKWTLQDITERGVPAVFPESLLDQLELKVGDQIPLSDEQERSYSYIVAGKYSGGSIGYDNPPILLPLSALTAMEDSKLRYRVARFQLDPTKNRELSTFRAQAKYILANRAAGSLPLQMVIWDEELKTVIGPLEKNLSLFAVLYPLTVALSAMIGMGLCLLLILQTAKEAAILRVLGVAKTETREALITEYMLISLIGVALGVIAWVWPGKSSSMASSGSVLFASGLYLLGSLFGSIVGSILVSNRKPLDLLQVKE